MGDPGSGRCPEEEKCITRVAIHKIALVRRVVFQHAHQLLPDLSVVVDDEQLPLLRRSGERRREKIEKSRRIGANGL